MPTIPAGGVPALRNQGTFATVPTTGVSALRNQGTFVAPPRIPAGGVAALQRQNVIAAPLENSLTGERRDAYTALRSQFARYGLEGLASKIFDYLKEGYSADTIFLLLQDTPEYRRRFAANEERKKAGLPVLPPDEYLSIESSYRQILQSAGLPKGFYDQPSDFTKWIAGGVSPSEIQSRVDLATQATTLSSPHYRRALNQMGISDNEMTAYFLDQKKALPILQKAAATAAVGAAALQQGLKFDQKYSELLATEGITAEEAQKGYSQIAQELPTLNQLGQIYGERYGQREAEREIFEGNPAPAQMRRRLASKERAQFAGGVGAARAGLSQRGGQY